MTQGRTDDISLADMAAHDGAPVARVMRTLLAAGISFRQEIEVPVDLAAFMAAFERRAMAGGLDERRVAGEPS